MAKLSYANNNTSWEIEAAAGFPASSPEFQRFLAAVEALHGAAGLQQYRVTKDESGVFKMRFSPGSFGIDYRYQDSRWSEQFKSSDWLSLQAAGFIRPVTELLVPLLNAYQITKIQFDWS